MSFDDGSRYLGEGFRQEPDFRSGGASTPTGPTPGPSGSVSGPPVSPAPESDSTLTIPRRVPPMPNLDYVFDDPADGEPGRDRMVVHIAWEVVLAVLAVGIGYLLLRAQSGIFGGAQLRNLLLEASVLGALAIGTALALRAGAVNLAIGPAAAASGLYYAQNADGGILGPVTVVVGICLIVGLVIGVLVVGLQVPGWAASLGVGVALYLWSTRQTETDIIYGYDPTKHAIYWFAGFCALSIFGGLVGLVPSVRRAVGRFRPVTDPADRRGVVAGLMTVGALAASTAFAGVGGILAAALAGSASPSDGLAYTALGLGAALLGGTSAFGRRGGVLGTVLAVSLLTVAMAWALATHRNWSTLAFAAVAIGVGLAVTRAVEHFGRPRLDEDSDEEEVWTASSATTDSWAPTASPSWQTAPAQTSTERMWGADGAWGTADRR